MMDLIARLEAADAGDDDLSLDVNIALEGGEPVHKTANFVMEPYYAIRRPNDAYRCGFENGPNWPVTKSVDAAMALASRVLPGWSCSVIMGNDRCESYVWPHEEKFADVQGKAARPALALCIAILKAKLAEEPTKG